MKFPVLLLTLAVTAAAQTPPRNENTVVLDAGGVANLGIETVQVEEADRIAPMINDTGGGESLRQDS